MAAPYEILAAPYTVYLGPVGETMPSVNAAVAGNWFKLGTSGDRNYDEDGVTVGHDQKTNIFRPAGSTIGRKAFREEEDFKIGFMLADISPTQYAKVLGDAAVTTVAQSTGVAGNKHFEVYQGLQVTTFALLARGISSVDEDLSAQYEIACVFQSASPEPVHNKGKAALLECEFTALDSNGDGAVGTVRIQTTVAGA